MSVRDRLQALADADLVAWPQMPARLLYALTPDTEVEVASGVADRSSGEPLRSGSRFRVASVTKSFVGASALRLVEDGRLDLGAPLDRLLPEVYLGVLRSGGYRTDAITLRHLLTHTSGLYDFAASAYDPSITDGYDQAIAQDPGHRWTRLDQIEFATSHGGPYGEPGEVFGYSDTGACLVGEIVERETGLELGSAVRSLVGYEGLGLRTTWFESLEPEPVDLPQLSHQYEGDVDVAGIDPSVDLYGGGGLMSTCADLARFFRGLLQGRVFRRPQTLATMTTCLVGVPPAAETAVDDDPSSAAMFLFREEIGGETWWGHGGWWGTTAFTCPRLDVTIVAGHQQAHMPEEFRRTQLLADAFAAL